MLGLRLPPLVPHGTPRYMSYEIAEQAISGPRRVTGQIFFSAFLNVWENLRPFVWENPRPLGWENRRPSDSDHVVTARKNQRRTSPAPLGGLSSFNAAHDFRYACHDFHVLHGSITNHTISLMSQYKSSNPDKSIIPLQAPFCSAVFPSSAEVCFVGKMQSMRSSSSPFSAPP